MIRRISATPCPTTIPARDENRRDSILSLNSETTANLDYTTEFKALFRNTRPRRRPTTISKRNGPALGFAIHEDEELKLEEGLRQSAPVDMHRKSTIMSQPAQRPKHRVSFVPPPKPGVPEVGVSHAPSTIITAPRRLSTQPGKLNPVTLVSESETRSQIPSPKISKPARRGTIYIPNDDTTVPSMYMAIFSPLKPDAAEGMQDRTRQLTGLAAQMAKKKAPRPSILAASPKRAPLLPSTNSSQSNVVEQDRQGSGSGKENIPPGYVRNRVAVSKKARMSMLSGYEAVQEGPVAQRQPSRLFEPTASSMARIKAQGDYLKPTVRTAWNSRSKTENARLAPLQPASNLQKPSYAEAQKKPTTSTRVPTRFIVPNVQAEPILQHFPLLPEGLHDVSMYEDKWLTQQEVAITQLVNSLYRSALPSSEDYQGHLLRIKLLEIYGESEMSLLYKRLQGALLFGALSLPKQAVENGKRLSNDQAHRKAFLDLWLKTYDLHLLRTAMEVVVGRSLSSEDIHTPSRSPPKALMNNNKTLHRAIETFLIRNEDSNSDAESGDHTSWSIQRTTLRSLMLIKLLDAVKTKQGMPQTPNLFQQGSICKTSISVVHQLTQLINPSVGDPIRPLGHLGFIVSHTQYPLEEYDYEIRNLAVDLRDGVRVTRLVELLLYRSASSSLGHIHDTDATTTLSMPTGEVLSLFEGHLDWPLSQHLKFPSLGRVTKIFNTQVALGALQSVKGSNVLFSDIRAEDIVDGHREKTVRLLWALTSKWGLSGLVSWEDLKKEIKRLGRAQGKVGDWFINELDMDEEDLEYLQYKRLLKEWVKTVASGHDLVVRNCTTSFADGRVFKAIIDEYRPYLPGLDQTTSQGSLASQLKSIGCSEQFVKLFEKTSGSVDEHVVDRDFVLASLAFLCSRLLGPTKRARAAVAIQRGWRCHWSQVIRQRKDVLHTLAAACAARVQRDEQQLQAKFMIWRSWRRYKTRKQRCNQNQSESGGVLSKAVSKSGSRLGLEDVVQEEDDIWLSLR